jgi:N-acetylornithine carbamoyltransferase
MELAGRELGAHVTTLNVSQGLWGLEWRTGVPMDGPAAEHIQEAIGVLSRYYQALGVRVFASFDDYESDRTEQKMQAIIKASNVPVINLESAFYHPCQALGDAATLMTHFGGKPLNNRRFVLSWAYHPKPLPMAVPNSALLTAARLGMQVTVARPDHHALDAGLMATARQYAAQHGTPVEETDDLDAACDGADVVYAKAWGGPLAYTDPELEANMRKANKHWRITSERMAKTREGAFMHCLPVRRGVVVDDDVLDSTQAIHLLQAEFRLHAQKAVLEYVWDL